MATFLVRYPKAQVGLDVTDRLVDLVPEGVDLAVRLGPVPANASLVTRQLTQPAAGLHASAEYLREHGVPRAPDDLQAHRTLTLGMLDSTPQWTLQRASESSAERLTPVLQTNDLPSLLHATLKGCGICMAPHFVCMQERSPEALLQVLPEWEVEGVDVRLLYPSRRGVTPLLRAFVDLLAERAPPLLDVRPTHGGERGVPPAVTQRRLSKGGQR